MHPPPSGMRIGASSGDIKGDEIEIHSSRPHLRAEIIASAAAGNAGEQMSGRW